MLNMLAVRYHGPKQSFTLDELVINQEIPENYVLVEVQAAALCHTELHFMDGTLDLGVYNVTMGHEAAGIIKDVGAGVDSSRIGERVIIYYYIGCGICRHCLVGNEQLCGKLKAEHGFITDGGLAKYIKTSSRNAVLLPDSIPFHIAAPIGCGVTTTVHASKLAEIRGGEWVAIFGVNGVGFGLIQLAKHLGAKVIGISRSQTKLNKALELGADAVIDATSTSVVANKVREITEGHGADVIFECVGSRETIDQCLGWTGALGKRGRIVFIGYQNGMENDIRIHPIPLIVNEQKILGSVGATREDLVDAIRYVERGIITPVVSHCIRISEFQTALDAMMSCQIIGKVVIDDFNH